MNQKLQAAVDILKAGGILHSKDFSNVTIRLALHIYGQHLKAISANP